MIDFYLFKRRHSTCCLREEINKKKSSILLAFRGVFQISHDFFYFFRCNTYNKVQIAAIPKKTATRAIVFCFMSVSKYDLYNHVVVRHLSCLLILSNIDYFFILSCVIPINCTSLQLRLFDNANNFYYMHCHCWTVYFLPIFDSSRVELLEMIHCSR